MDGVITALTTALTPSVFFGVVEDLVPWLVVIVPVALALYFIRRTVKGASKAKAKF